MLEHLFLGVMKKQVDEVEQRVDQAEKDLDMGMGSNLKKVFTSFFPKRQTQVIDLQLFELSNSIEYYSDHSPL